MSSPRTSDASETTVSETVPGDGRDGWCAFVGFHSLRGALGRWRRILASAPCAITRGGGAFGPDVLDDPRISRDHATLSVDDLGELSLEDHGSSNGTHVNGNRVKRVTLHAGDVVRFGSLLIVVRRAGAPALRERRDAMAGVSARVGEILAAVESAVARREPLVFAGEAHTGAVEIAREAHRQVGSLWVEGSLEGWSERLPDQWIEAARQPSGVLFTRSLPPRGSPAASAMRDVLSARRPDGPWMVFDTTSPTPRTTEAAEAAREAGLRVLTLPSLRDRSEDLAHIAARWCEAQGRAWPLGGYRGWQSMLCAGWPGNLAQAEALVRECARAADAREELDVAEWLARSQWEPKASAGSAAPGATVLHLEVGAEGRWFLLPSTGRVGLHRRPVLSRLLMALVRARVDRPAAVLNVDALIAEVWPGEKLMEGSGDNRLHVALTHLRQLGLKNVIERIEDGYRLSPSVAIALRAE